MNIILKKSHNHEITKLFFLKKESNSTQFNKNHKTRPIIFYKGKFIGGYNDLLQKLN